MSDVVRAKGKVTGVNESVPFHMDLYTDLGDARRDRGPSQLEEELVAVVDRLAAAPAPMEELVDELNLDRADAPTLLDLGMNSHLVKVLRSIDGDLVYSPFYAFENPKVMDELVAAHGSDRLAEELALLHKYQGLPVVPMRTR